MANFQGWRLPNSPTYPISFFYGFVRYALYNAAMKNKRLHAHRNKTVIVKLALFNLWGIDNVQYFDDIYDDVPHFGMSIFPHIVLDVLKYFN